jgi:hypothetical protein
MSGGGGDNSYAEKQAQIEASKQRARDALNVAFGVRPTGTAPNAAQYTSRQPITQDGTVVGSPMLDGSGGGNTAWEQQFGDVLNQGAFDEANGAWNGSIGQADTNKAARDALYGTVRQGAFDAGHRKLADNREKALRDTRYALFAQGLNGGSADVDENALLGRTYDQGVLDLSAKADATKADMRSNDEKTRLGLLQAIDAGTDQGSVLSSALQQMQVNSDRAAADAAGTDLGDLFSNAGLLYTKSQYARGQQAAGTQPWWNTFSAPNSSSRGRGAANGTVTSIGG